MGKVPSSFSTVVGDGNDTPLEEQVHLVTPGGGQAQKAHQDLAFLQPLKLFHGGPGDFEDQLGAAIHLFAGIHNSRSGFLIIGIGKASPQARTQLDVARMPFGGQQLDARRRQSHAAIVVSPLTRHANVHAISSAIHVITARTSNTGQLDTLNTRSATLP
jgi:hypothetical protein